MSHRARSSVALETFVPDLLNYFQFFMIWELLRNLEVAMEDKNLHQEKILKNQMKILALQKVLKQDKQ